jgi:tight adherence protein C
MFLYLVYICIVASVLLCALALSARTKPTALPIKELTEQQTYRSTKQKVFFKIFRFAIPLNKLIVDRLGREKFTNKVIGSGLKLSPEEFLLAWELSFAASYFLISYFITSLTGKMETNFSIILLCIGLIFPQLWLKILTTKRKGRILRVLPDSIDLVALCVNAGLDFSLAVKWIVDKSKPSPLTEEFALFLLETKVGKSRRQALKDMARRVNIHEMNSFARSVAQAERLGTPIEAALTTLAEDIRELRFRNGERAALLAPLKMLFPLLFFIMPVVGIIVGGPIILQFITTGISTNF